MRAVLFDAHDAPGYRGGGDMACDDDEVPEVPEVQVTDGQQKVVWRKQMEPTISYSPAVPGFRRHVRDLSVRAVIESDLQHPMCEKYRQMLEEEFEDVFCFKPHTELEKFPGLRGEHGTCRVELGDNPQRKSVEPYRCVGIRAAAFKALIEKFQGCGMLREAKGDPQWVSGAFLVPKPGRKRRLVIDYRHLNSQIRDVIYPLPIIEDKILDEGQNVLWSSFRLRRWFPPNAAEGNLQAFDGTYDTMGGFRMGGIANGAENDSYSITENSVMVPGRGPGNYMSALH